MNFLRNKKLRHLGAAVSILTLFVFTAEYFFVGNRQKKLDDAVAKVELTRIAQLQNQRISAEVTEYLHGRKDLAASIAAHIDEQENRLATIRNGGRMEQENVVLGPLNRLARITFNAMLDDWKEYRNSVYLLMSAEQSAPAIARDSSGTDEIALLVRNNAGAARVRYEGLALGMANWYDKLIADLDDDVAKASASLQTTRRSLLALNAALIAATFYFFLVYVVRPMKALAANIADQRQTTGFAANEIGLIAERANETIESLKDAAEFVSAIGQGNLSIDYKKELDPGYAPGKSRLADSLLTMQAKLVELNEEEQRRKWENDGLAKFVDILRSGYDDLRALGDKVVSALVHYTHSNQGALYILNDEDPNNVHLELISLFAFDVRKHEQQQIKPGQGILGQAFLERDTTYLTYLPDEYVRITSGLGGARPKAILIVPLKVDRDVYGLVELASFTEFRPHEIAFVEKLGETIASTLASVRGAQRNKMLIEQFQLQHEQMRAQEEEMRQNMEELQATQEELARKEKTYVETIRELEAALRGAPDPAQVKELTETFARKEKEWEKAMDQLREELTKKAAPAEDWIAVSELEKTLRINLEALAIMRKYDTPAV